MEQDPKDALIDQLRIQNAQLEARRSTTLTGVQFIVLITFVPLVFALIVLGGRMIWSATSNPETLANMEGLLAGLAIISNPVSAGMGLIMGAFVDEIKLVVRATVVPGVKTNEV